MNDSAFPIRLLADYRGVASASSFASNKRVVYSAIEEALERCRKLAIRCTRVDVVGHSMGGLLARIHGNSPLYATSLNRYHGNVRKLVTLDTPHQGSPLANFLSSIALDPTSRGERMRAAFAKLNMYIDQGAIYDLSTGSGAIEAIEESPVPAHAQVGTGGPDTLSLVVPPMRDFYAVLSLVSVVTGTDLFGPLEHDVVVGRISQEGGLPAAATTLFGFPDGIHTRNTGSVAYSNRVRELLDTPTSSSSWALLPAQSVSLENLEPFSPLDPGADTEGEGFELTITSPLAGAVIEPGSTISVTVVPNAGIDVTEVLVVGPLGAARDTSAPFEVSFEVPLEAFRAYTITAFGKDAAAEAYFQSADVTLIAQPTATLQSLQIDPTEAFIVGPGDTLPLFVRGLFSDGFPREVPSAEVVWTSLTPSIVAVNSLGVATGLAVGTGTVRADFQAMQTSRTVTVLVRPPLVFVDNFESGNTGEWTASQP